MSNRYLLLLLLTYCLTSFGSCSDAERAKYSSFGNSHTVKCYSGSEVIYDGIASGKVLSEDGSDGYYFKEKSTGVLMEVSGNCIIKRMEN